METWRRYLKEGPDGIDEELPGEPSFDNPNAVSDEDLEDYGYDPTGDYSSPIPPEGRIEHDEDYDSGDDSMYDDSDSYESGSETVWDTDELDLPERDVDLSLDDSIYDGLNADVDIEPSYDDSDEFDDEY